MADEIDLEAVAALRKKRQFRKFTYKGLELEKLLDLSHDELLAVVTARARRRMQRGLKRKPMALIKKLRKVKAGKFISVELSGCSYCRPCGSCVSD
jgi:small subunit ribosomal protein S15e